MTALTATRRAVASDHQIRNLAI